MKSTITAVTFPQNILAALDALVELGKVAYGKTPVNTWQDKDDVFAPLQVQETKQG